MCDRHSCFGEQKAKQDLKNKGHNIYIHDISSWCIRFSYTLKYYKNFFSFNDKLLNKEVILLQSQLNNFTVLSFPSTVGFDN